MSSSSARSVIPLFQDQPLKGSTVSPDARRPIECPDHLPAGRPPGAEKVPPPRLPECCGPVASRSSRRVGQVLVPPPEPSVRRKRKKKGVTATGFADHLVARISTRSLANGHIHFLDLRGKKWAHLRPGSSGCLTIRNPQDSGWPVEGSTTGDPATAEAWVRDHYVSWLERRALTAATGAKSGADVRQACGSYIAELVKVRGVDHNTTKNRKSVCTRHIVPYLGKFPLDALTKTKVRDFLRNLTVRKKGGGKVEVVPASIRTKANIRDALNAVWGHVYEDVTPPFAGIRLKDSAASKNRRAAAEAGEMGGREAETAYTYGQVVELLTAAVQYDEEVIGRPNLVRQYHQNTADMIAVMLGTNARCEEVTFLRWKHVLWDERAIYISGTKTHNSPRWVPLQRSLEAWLRRLMEQQGGDPTPESFILQIRRRQPARRASRKTVGGRIARVEVRAGLKLEQKATHILRATHLSWAKDHLSLEDLKTYAGHGAARGGATDAYMDRRPPFMPAEHREYLPLPSPAEIEELVHARSTLRA